jgi:hypothetical protein
MGMDDQGRAETRTAHGELDDEARHEDECHGGGEVTDKAAVISYRGRYIGISHETLPGFKS